MANVITQMKVNLCKDVNHLVIKFLPTGADVKIARENSIQAKTLLLSLLNSGLLSATDVSRH